MGEKVRVGIFGGDKRQRGQIRATLAKIVDIEVAADRKKSSSSSCDVAIVVANGKERVPQCCPAIVVIPSARKACWEASLGAPAAAFVRLRSLEHTLSSAVWAARNGALMFDGHMARVAVGRLREQGDEQPSAYEISEMEAEILRRIARGETNAEIGRALTVNRQKLGRMATALFWKIGVRNRTAAAAWWVRQSVLNETE